MDLVPGTQGDKFRMVQLCSVNDLYLPSVQATHYQINTDGVRCHSSCCAVFKPKHPAILYFISLGLSVRLRAFAWMHTRVVKRVPALEVPFPDPRRDDRSQ